MSIVARRARIDLKKTAFFVCDIQERFKTAISNFDHVVATSAKMLRASSILEVPVFTTEQNPKALGRTVSPLNELIAELPTLSSKAVFPKTRFSMFIPGITDEWLEKAGPIEHVVIFGIGELVNSCEFCIGADNCHVISPTMIQESHVCVLQTTLDLLEKGFQVHVLRDGVSSCNDGEIGTALEHMKAAGAQITSSESILFQMLVDSAHPKFKAISSLIKEEKESTKAAVNTLGLAKY
ncbi:Isochorismatase hydrolase [Violaceomyces palustris]|uniref:Isochorismatase hydrolase n=1 Tax=Violaceomyces palustris TaxID=1673888 RepID=A0ACD0P8Z8_9BASI|nr:Isochorismatase hydrolase [Violaceomyces palustris]